MKFSLGFCLSALLMLGGGFAGLHASEQWETSYKAALDQAAKQDKLVLLDFTGSDWCGWCIKLRKDTFSKPEFQKLKAIKKASSPVNQNGKKEILTTDGATNRDKTEQK